MRNGSEQPTAGLTRYLSPLGVWALSFGCAVGWGAFVMPGTTFLPVAGPLGTAIGMAAGAVIMLIIGVNYHFLMNRYPDAGGTLTYAARAFGYDHGFLSSWFLILVYVAIMWANATALVLVFRTLLPGLLQFGPHYQVSGYDVYLGEALAAAAAIALVGAVCAWGKRLAVWLQTALAVLLLGGIVIAFAAVMARSRGMAAMAPAFAPTGQTPPLQVLRIVVLAPWAFVGFESVSHSAEDFRFSPKKTLPILAAALGTGALAYILLALIGAAIQPAGAGGWPVYLGGLGSFQGMSALPVFYAARIALGRGGVILLAVTLLGAVFTGLIGNLIAASRLLYGMAEKDILPRWFRRTGRNGAPRNAILFLLLMSLPIPFLGRTAIGWIVDVNTIGAVIAYGYTSAAAWTIARREGGGAVKATGLLGLILSLGFFLYFMISSGSMATESYLILALWSILGFLFFRYVFSRDTAGRFGKSTVVWIGLLFLIFLTSLLWVRQSTNAMTNHLIVDISDYYEEQYPDRDRQSVAATEQYLSEQMDGANRFLIRNSLIQMGLCVAALGIMFSIYTTMSRRERQAQEARMLAERAQAELELTKATEISRAKSTFLANMSHDIRTPMNAIIGYTAIARKEPDLPPVIADYLGKIDSTSQHLLALINDVLEMSRIESGKMDLEPVNVNLRETVAEVHDMFSPQMEAKRIRFTVDADRVAHPYVICDKHRLNRVLLNLLSNACKFTPEDGAVSVTLTEAGGAPEGLGDYELRVRDTGIGMSWEFAERVFEAFTRERTSTVSGIQGTGLGMAITKSIVDMMGGTIDVQSAPGEGTEFLLRLRLPLQSEADVAAAESAHAAREAEAPDFTGTHVLLTDDNEINREIAVYLLEDAGFTVDTAENGQQAVDILRASRPGDYAAVLMDIQMPVMNGYDATRAIRALEDPALAGIPVVAMTANAFAEDIQAAKDAGMDGHIAKPIDVPRMLETLAGLLR